MSNENKLISENLEEISQAKVMARLAGRSYLDPDDPERQKEDSVIYFLTAKVTPITAVMSFLIVEVS